MTRFSIDNMFRVSFEQFKKVAERLDDAIRAVRPDSTSKLLLTTNESDYFGVGSLTIVTPETEAAWDRRETVQLADLDADLWERSYLRSLVINDETFQEPYMICLNNEKREPKRLRFYAQGVDIVSQDVFESFKKAGFLQKIGDGYSKPSDFAVARALSRFD